MSNNYITLTYSTRSPSWKFKVVEGGYQIIMNKAQTENETIGGIDVAMGAIHETDEYIIKARQDRWIVTSSGSYRQEADDIGTLADLEAFYMLNNPQGTPTNVITLTDHFGTQKSVYFIGAFPKVPLTTIIEGGGALYFVPCRFRVIPQ